MPAVVTATPPLVLSCYLRLLISRTSSALRSSISYSCERYFGGHFMGFMGGMQPSDENNSAEYFAELVEVFDRLRSRCRENI